MEQPVTYTRKIKIGSRQYDVGNISAEHSARLLMRYNQVITKYTKSGDDIGLLRDMAGLVVYAVRRQIRFEDWKHRVFAYLLTRRYVLRRLAKAQLNDAIEAILVECLGEDKKKEMDLQNRATTAMVEALGPVTDSELVLLFKSLQPFLDALRQKSGKAKPSEKSSGTGAT